MHACTRLAAIAALLSPNLCAQAEVPFVGCPSIGQQERPAPVGKPKRLPLTAAEAGQLSFYRAGNGMELLGPRGWHCIGIEGSSGISVHLRPQPPYTGRGDLLELRGDGLVAVEILWTSGRASVAEMIFRLFPKEREAALSTLRDFGDTYSVEVYPWDRYTYRNPSLVEFVTHRDSDGLGQWRGLQGKSHAIHGIVSLRSDATLLYVAMRVPPAMDPVRTAILADVIRREERRKAARDALGAR